MVTCVSALARACCRSGLLCVLSLGTGGAVGAGTREALTCYVATDGNDAWSGSLQAPNTARTDGPFATLERARDELRAQRQRTAAEAAPRAHTVLVREGVYHLGRPLVLGPEDSGTEAAPVTYAAYPGESVELRGSRDVTGWKRHQGSVYKADLGSASVGTDRLWQLFYKGQRQILARCPNVDPRRPRSGGLLYLTATLDAATQAPLAKPPQSVLETVSRTALQYDARRLNPARWSRPTEARVQMWPWLNWNRECIEVKSANPETHLLVLQRPASYPLTQGNRFYVENVKEELDSPGEWYYDGVSKELFFWPPDRQDPAGQVSVPLLPTLLEFRGNQERNEFVSHVTLQGFRLCESADTLIELRMAAYCTVAACALERCGGTAIEIAERSHHNRIAGCDIAHAGGRGIALTEVRDWTHNLEGRTSYNTFCNNHVHDIGESQTAVGAIAIEPACGGNVSHDNVICHNLIHDTPHQGISFDGFRNVVEYNHVHHTNLECSDSGGIGMGSRDIQERGSIIRHNLVHDTGGYSMTSPGIWRYPHFTWGIYLDGYTSGVQVLGNIIAHAPRGGIKIHGGQDNLIENNVIADCGGQQIEYDPIDSLKMGTAGRNPANPDKTLWLMTGTRVVRNVFSYADKRALWIAARQPRWQQMLAESQRNLIWHHGKPVSIGLTGERPSKEDTWAGWQAMGYDTESIIADPLFVAPSHDDYRLREGSPAFRLGFQPIPVERIGLFQSPERASWPAAADNGPRERRLTRPTAGWWGRLRGWLRDAVVRWR